MYDNMQNLSHISVVWSQQWRRRRQRRGETAQVSLLNRKSLPPLWGETADHNSFLGTHAAPLWQQIALVPIHWKKRRRKKALQKERDSIGSEVRNREGRDCKTVGLSLDCYKSSVSCASFRPSHLQTVTSISQSQLSLRRWQSTKHTNNTNVTVGRQWTI